MLAVIDRSAPFVRNDDRGRRLADAVRSTCDVVVEADGPNAIVRQIVGIGREVRDVVCLGRPSTTSAALTGAWVGGADVRTLRVRHLGGAGLDPWAATIGAPGDPEARWNAVERPRGHCDVSVVQVDDALAPWSCLGLVFAAGVACDAVAGMLRGAEGRLARWKGVGRAVSGMVAASQDPQWRAGEWSLAGQPLAEADTFVVASTANISLGPLELTRADDALQAWSGAWSGGVDALRALGGGRRPVRSATVDRVEGDGSAGWLLDGWRHEGDERRALTVRVGPTISFFV